MVKGGLQFGAGCAWVAVEGERGVAPCDRAGLLGSGRGGVPLGGLASGSMPAVSTPGGSTVTTSGSGSSSEAAVAEGAGFGVEGSAIVVAWAGSDGERIFLVARA